MSGSRRMQGQRLITGWLETPTEHRSIGRTAEAGRSCGVARLAMPEGAALLAAFRVAAAGALVAVFEADQRGFAAFRALPQARSGEPARLGAEADDLRLERALAVRVFRRQEADLDHVALDDVADRGQERGDVAALHPGAPPGIEH